MMLKSYGRRQGRKLGAHRAFLMEDVLPKVIFDPFETKYRSLWVEIGSGNGENLCLQALNFPDVLHVGCEIYRPALSESIDAIEKLNLPNVRLWAGDGRLLLEQLPDYSIDKLFILFPDPWPKKRHHKRRLIQSEFLALCAKKLKGDLLIATDHQEYGRWILWQIALNQCFSWKEVEKRDWNNAPSIWHTTKYQRKSLAGDHPPLFLHYTK